MKVMNVQLYQLSAQYQQKVNCPQSIYIYIYRILLLGEPDFHSLCLETRAISITHLDYLFNS